MSCKSFASAVKWALSFRNLMRRSSFHRWRKTFTAHFSGRTTICSDRYFLWAKQTFHFYFVYLFDTSECRFSTLKSNSMCAASVWTWVRLVWLTRVENLGMRISLKNDTSPETEIWISNTSSQTGCFIPLVALQIARHSKMHLCFLSWQRFFYHGYAPSSVLCQCG